MTDEMHSLLAKFFSGQATEEESGTVQSWAASSEENYADFKLLEKLWSTSGQHDEVVFDTDKAWHKVDATLNPAVKPARTVRMFPRRAMAAAAIAVLLLGAFWIYRSMFGDRTVYADVADKKVQLEDGSNVYLRKGAKLQYPNHFAENERKVSLSGEAFFEVRHNPSKPFKVSTQTTEVEVLGTSFNLHADNKKTTLFVKTGRVRFTDVDDVNQTTIVSAGEMAVHDRPALSKQAIADANFDAWHTKELVFNNTPMQQVVSTLSNYFNVKIYIREQDRHQVSATGLTARFTNEPLSTVLDQVALITSYRIHLVEPNVYEISIK
jgi:transmembrane sensor